MPRCVGRDLDMGEEMDLNLTLTEISYVGPPLPLGVSERQEETSFNVDGAGFVVGGNVAPAIVSKRKESPEV